MQVRTLKLKNVDFGRQWFDEALDHWDYRDFKNRPDWRKAWISFDCALYDAADDRVYLGITSFDSDIFKAYDRKTDQFVDLGYCRVSGPFDAKFHRSLCKSKDGCIYAAIALLHDTDSYMDAPGSPIVKYDPASGSISKMAIPVPHAYIQAITLDDEQRMIYCLCFPPEKLASYDLRTGKTQELGLIGPGIGGMVQSENIELDDTGCAWSGWGLIRAWQYAPGADSYRLCKYDPNQQRIVFYRNGLPRPDGQYGTVRPEAFFNFHDDFMYASGANGSLFRIDPETGAAEYLFTPTTDRNSRLSSLIKTEDGVAWGVTGREGKCEFMCIDYRKGAFEKLGPICDEEGTALWQCHHIVHAGGGVFYVCENDNPYRSSYLWEITVDSA